MQPGAWGGETENAGALAPESSHSSPNSSREFREEREELRRVLDHPEFSRSANLVRFLTYICEKYFDGNAGEIREYSIAIEALGRRESDFDSRFDPIVRVTARTLRKKLRELYQTNWHDHAIQIVLPLGHYVPEFVRRDDAAQLEANALLDVSEEVSAPEAVTKLAGLWRQIRQVLRGPIPRFSLWAAVTALVFVAGYYWGMYAVRPHVLATESFHWGKPVWAAEFNGPAGQLPDPSKWTFDTGTRDKLGDQGWGNDELETYCAPNGANPPGCNPHKQNAFLDGNGHLVLQAQRSPDGTWTSARITTRGLKNFQYGRIEARIKMPVGAGLWPAFWMLGSNYSRVGWPASGSVTIAENVSRTQNNNGLGPTMIRSTLHGPHYFGGNGLWHDYKLPDGGRIDDGKFHTYGIIWSPGMIQFYVDNPANVFFVRDASDLPEDGEWVFNHPFFLVMDLAVGGNWAGNPDAATPNPADMVVDYVRVYKIPKVEAPAIQWQPVKVRAGSSVASVITFHAKEYSSRVHVTCSVVPATVGCSLATTVVNLSNTLSQDDSVTLSTTSFGDQGSVVAQPGKYKLTITATSISGNHSQLTVPFEVKGT